MLNETITDKNFGLVETKLDNPRKRKGARGIVVNKNGKIAVFNKQVKNEYKLPGGGVDDGENTKDAFIREVFEETGCTIKDIKEIGTVTEIQNKENFIQESYVFVAEIDEMGKELSLTQKEKDEEARLIWLEPEDALNVMEGCLNELRPSKYDSVYRSKFMVQRDCIILKYYLSVR